MIEISIDGLLDNETKISDGKYLIHFQGASLQMFVEGIERRLPEKLLVNFSGAVKRINNYKPPFFSGRGVAKELRVPLVAFSDPTLELDDSITLAWYAGNYKKSNLYTVYAKIIESICYKVKETLHKSHRNCLIATDRVESDHPATV